MPIIALTATADEATRADIAAQLFDGAVETLVLGFDRPNIKLTVAAQAATASASCWISSRAITGDSGIVYCLSRKKTEEDGGVPGAQRRHARCAYHAGMNKEARDANQNRFMTEPGIVMVATIAFGMGIDKPDVRLCLPHRSAGQPGSLLPGDRPRGPRRRGRPRRICCSALGDIRMRRMFIDEEDAGEDRKRREHERLNTLIGYCEAPRCRRQILLRYFGESAEPCGNCDNCLDPARAHRRHARMRARCSTAVRDTGERFGADDRRVIDGARATTPRARRRNGSR